MAEALNRLQAAVENCISKGTSYELELRAIRKDGMIRQCVARGQAECDGSGPYYASRRFFPGHHRAQTGGE